MKRFVPLLNQQKPKIDFKAIEENVKKEALASQSLPQSEPKDFDLSQKSKETRSELLKKFQQEKKTLLDRMEDKFESTRSKIEQDALDKNKISPEMKKMADEFFGLEQNLLQREKLLREAGREGYFDNAKEIVKKGIKLWEAGDKLRPNAISPKMVDFKGKWMDKSTTSLLERLYSKKVTLVCFMYNHFGEKHVQSFVNPFLKEFGDNDQVGLLEINVNEQRVKSPILKLLTPYIRWRMPKERRKRYMILHKDIYDERQTLGMKNNALGWVNLIDSNGYVRWQAHGIATEKELENLSKLTARLIQGSK